GVAAVVVLAAAQLAGGRFCGSCGVAYALTLSYAGLCLFSGSRHSWAQLARAGLLAGAAAGLGVGALRAASRARPGRPRAVPQPAARPGSPMAPVRITDFADFLGSHCAALHATLAQLQKSAP